MRLRALLSLWLVLAAFEADAATLYRWVTEDGRVEIGTSPPPGVNAVPWRPGQAEEPATPAAAPAPPLEPEAAPVARRGNAESEQKRERCRKLRDEARELTSSIAKKEAEIAALETRIAELEASDVMYSRTDCRNDAQQGDRYCESRVFDREKEIARVEAQARTAQDQLDELEQNSRAVNLAECDASAKR